MSAEEAVPWGSIGRVALASLGNLTAIGLLLPIFPLWAEALAPSSAEIGLVTTLALGVGLVLARPLAGRWMEGRRRAPLMMVGVAINVLACALYPSVASLPTLMALRLLNGLGFGWVTTGAVSAMTDLAPPARRGQMMGYFGAVNALALIIGPGVGSALKGALGFDAVFYGAAGLSALAALPLLGLSEPPKPPIQGKVALRAAWQIPALRVLVITHFLTYLLHGTVITFLPKLLQPGGEDQPSVAGWMTVGLFFAIQAGAVVGLRVVVGRRFDQIDRNVFISGGRLGLLLAGVLLGVTVSPWLLLVAAVLYGVGQGAYLPAANALVGDVLPGELRARGFALFLLAFDLGFACGGTLAGLIADVLSVPTAFIIMGTLPGIAWAVQRWGWRQRPTAPVGG